MLSKYFLFGTIGVATLMTSPSWDIQSSLQAQSSNGTRQAPANADPYVRYTTPGRCEQAAIRLTAQYWRDKRPDTVVYAPETDSVPAVALQAARACASRFTVQSVAKHELLDLAQLYLLGKQDDLARAAVERLMAETAQEPLVQRGWILNLLATSYLQARPTRLTEARQYLSQLDALGNPVAVWRMFAHSSFARYTMSVNDLASAMTHGKTAVTASEEMAQNDRIDWANPIISAFSSLADPTSVYTDGPAALAVMDRANNAVLPLRPDGSREQDFLRGSLNAVRAPYSLFGTQGAELSADHWYNNSGSMGTFPRAKAVSLVVFANHACGGNCFPTYSTLRRLHEKFGNRGLDIVLVASTTGYYRNRLQQPAPESDSAGRYFVDFLKLPGVIAIDESEYSKKPDGRRVNEPTMNMRNYARGRGAVLVDKYGRIRMAVNAIPSREKVLETAIESALQ